MSAARRLANDPWLWDNDFVDFNRVLAAQLQGQGAEQLNFVDPQQVNLLVHGDGRQRNDVLRHLVGPDTPPFLFLPVNNNNHWSLLVVDRRNAQAFHYDSMVSPHKAHRATNTAQFGIASRVAQALGVEAPRGMPMARQNDTHSCGDHVLFGIQALAPRVLSGDFFRDGGMDLSGIRPDRAYIVDVLTQAEQFGTAATDTSQPRAKEPARGKTWWG